MGAGLKSGVTLVDVDGVLADFVGHVIRTSGVDMTHEDAVEWDLFGLMGEQGIEAKRALKDLDWWLGIDPMPGAQAAIERMRSRPGSRVVIVTSPWVSCKGWGWARYRWLDRHFGIRSRDVVITKAKDLVEGDRFIDDHPETVAKWQHLHPLDDAELFDAPHNRHTELLIGPFKRIYGWPKETQ
jgi:5'(3')-deoxyribonucleotidase